MWQWSPPGARQALKDAHLIFIFLPSPNIQILVWDLSKYSKHEIMHPGRRSHHGDGTQTCLQHSSTRAYWWHCVSMTMTAHVGAHVRYPTHVHLNPMR